jgi:uncharacterized membrane protein YccC
VTRPRSYRHLARGLATFFALFLAALGLGAFASSEGPLVGMIVMTAGLCVAGAYGKRVRRRAGF